VRAQRLVGDVWSAHLPYAEQYLKLDPTAKLVVLERPRSEVVASFANKSSPRGATEAQCMAAAEGQPRCRNHWQQWRAGVWWDADNWDAFFPNFPGELQPPAPPSLGPSRLYISLGLLPHCRTAEARRQAHAAGGHRAVLGHVRQRGGTTVVQVPHGGACGRACGVLLCRARVRARE